MPESLIQPDPTMNDQNQPAEKPAKKPVQTAPPAPVFRYRVTTKKVTIGDVIVHPNGEALLTDSQFTALESKQPGNLKLLGI